MHCLPPRHVLAAPVRVSCCRTDRGLAAGAVCGPRRQALCLHIRRGTTPHACGPQTRLTPPTHCAHSVRSATFTLTTNTHSVCSAAASASPADCPTRQRLSRTQPCVRMPHRVLNALSPTQTRAAPNTQVLLDLLEHCSRHSALTLLALQTCHDAEYLLLVLL